MICLRPGRGEEISPQSASNIILYSWRKIPERAIVYTLGKLYVYRGKNVHPTIPSLGEAINFSLFI